MAAQAHEEAREASRLSGHSLLASHTRAHPLSPSSPAPRRAAPRRAAPRRAPPRFAPQIGRGAYGVVASAHDSRTGYRVAIKRISRLFSDLIDAKRILREIKLLRHLSMHDNVVGLLDIMTGPPDCEDFHT